MASWFTYKGKTLRVANESQLISAFRRKYIITMLILMAMVLGVVFIIVLSVAYQNERNDIENSMRQAYRNPASSGHVSTIIGEGPDDDLGKGPTFKDENASKRAISKVVPVCVIYTDFQGDTFSLESPVKMNSQLLHKAIHEAINTPNYAGTLKDLKLFYRIFETTNGYHIAFADARPLENHMKNLVLLGLATIAVTLFAFLFIAIWLSKLAVHPIEEAWETQKRFIADASHELKTPLTVILTTTQILLDQPNASPAEQRKWIVSTREEAQMMQELVQDLLTLSKLQSQETEDPAKIAETFTQINFTDMVKRAVMQFEVIAFEKGASIAEQIDNDVTVLGKEIELERLLKILLDNACKYVNDSGSIQVVLEKLSTTCVISINNTGSVIPPEDLQNIFRRFYRSDSSRDRQSGGYGLGLAIAREIVNKHGGLIRAASDEESGTTFYVEMPLYREPNSTPPN